MTTIPTTAQLIASTKSALEAEFGTTLPTFGKNVLRVLSVVIGGALKLYYLAIGALQKNIFVDTCDDETILRYGQVKLGRLPFPATNAEYEVTVTGTLSAVIPAQTQFKSDDDSASPGMLYILDEAFTMGGTSDTITLRALEAGTGSKLSIGDTLTATAPIIGVNSGASVSAEPVEPQAAETIAEYRRKTILSYRLEAQGGAASDYRQWGLDAQGVAQIYPYAVSGSPNEVDVFVEAATTVDPQGIPTLGILGDVEDVIELDPDTTLPIEERGRRPLTVFAVNVQAITPLDVDLTITGFVDLTTEKENLINAAWAERVSSVRPFIAGCDNIADRDDIISENVAVSVILSAVPNAVFTGVTLEVNGVTVATYTFDLGNIPYNNSVTYA